MTRWFDFGDFGTQCHRHRSRHYQKISASLMVSDADINCVSRTRHRHNRPNQWRIVKEAGGWSPLARGGEEAPVGAKIRANILEELLANLSKYL